MLSLGWLFFLVLAGLAGRALMISFIPDGLSLTSPHGQVTDILRCHRPLQNLVRVLASLWIGLIVLTTAVYLLTTLFVALTRANTTPGATQWPQLNAAFIAVSVLTLPVAVWRLVSEPKRSPTQPWPRLRSVMGPAFGGLIVILYTVWLLTSTFATQGTTLLSGASVFSDLAPHTAMTASFAVGQNIPTVYPHFAGDGVAHHFFFYFLAGCLARLGLPLVTAINLPSALALISALCLMGAFAYRLTGRRWAWPLTLVLVVFRSSLAGFTALTAWIKDAGGLTPAFWSQLWHHNRFIGETTHDDWGLWTINVYANQRHLAVGFILVIIVCWLALDDLETPADAASLSWRRSLITPSWWTIRKRADGRRLAFIALIMAVMPYWHGSMTIALLVILFVVALLGRNRLGYVAIALTTIVAGLLWMMALAPKDLVPHRMAVQFGFLASSPTLGASLLYLLHIFGLGALLTPIAIVLAPPFRRRYAFAALAPLVVAFCIRLSIDITANHKDVLLTSWLLIPLIADLWLAIARRPGFGRVIACITLVLLTWTGLYEHRLYHVINHPPAVRLALDDPLTTFVATHTSPRAVILSAPYTFSPLTASGRPLTLGHTYYAWSAGHDVLRRERALHTLLTAPTRAAAMQALRALPADYLLDDEAWRRAYPAYDPARMRAWFPTVYRQGTTHLLDLKPHRNPKTRTTSP